jgi:hypothetical protein
MMLDITICLQKGRGHCPTSVSVWCCSAVVLLCCCCSVAALRVRLERQMSLLKNHVFENERVSVFSKIAFLRMSG